MIEEAPITLANYKFLSPIGEGGMGRVWLGQQINPKRRVAIKVIAPDENLPPALLEALTEEGNIAAQFEHENLVRVIECGITEGHYYLVMQHLPGGSLEDLLREGPVPTTQAIEITRAIASALHEIHSRGFLHRDVKPANILFNAKGSPVLADFGIAKKADSAGALTSAGYSLGTPAYMSPEQIRNEDLDGRSDLYSLGIVLFEMLMGRTPFRAENAHSMKEMHLSADVPRLTDDRVDMQRVMDRLLAKSARDRFSSAEELIRQLDRSGSVESTTPMPSRPAESDSVATQWFRELKERRVVRTSAIYVAAAWGLTEIGKTVAETLQAPEWIPTALVIAFVIGFPIVTGLAWIYDLRLSRSKRASERTERRMLMLAGALSILVVAVSAISFSIYRLPSERQDQARPAIESEEPIRSIAVLPFDDFSPGGGQVHVADGISEAIIHALAQHEQLLVSARSSSFYFRDKDATLPEIGRALGVQALVEGSIQIVDEQLRVTTQLVSASDQRHIWSNVYEGSIGDIFRVQDSIADRVLELVLDEENVQPSSTSQQSKPNADAYVLLLRAKSLRHVDRDEAIALARKATELAPDYADAHAWLGHLIYWKMVRTSSESRRELQEEAEEALARALEIDPEHGVALLVMGHLAQSDSWKAMSEYYERALEAAPNDPEVLRSLATREANELNYPKARELTTRARMIDPQDVGVLRQYLFYNCGRETVGPIVESALQNFPQSDSVAESLRLFVVACDGTPLDYLKAELALTRTPFNALMALSSLVSLGHKPSLEQYARAHVLWPAQWEIAQSDYSLYFTDTLDERLGIYRWQIDREHNPGIFPVAYAKAMIMAGYYEEAEKALAGVLDLRNRNRDAEDIQVTEVTLDIYAHRSWLMTKNGKSDQAELLSRQLYESLQERGLTAWGETVGRLNDLPLMVLVINHDTDAAISWLRDAEEDHWLNFQPVLSSPIYESFRENQEVADILARMVSWRQRVLEDALATGIPEVLDPALLTAIIESEFGVPHVRLGDIALQRNDLIEASLHYGRAIRAEPDDYEAIEGAVRLTRALGRFDQAIALGEHSVSLEPNDASRLLSLGYSHFLAGHYEEAIGYARSTSAMGSDAPPVNSWLSLAYLMSGDVDLALTTAQDDDSEMGRIRGLVLANHALGNHDDSDSALATIIEKYGEEHELTVAGLLAYRGQKDLAFEWLDKVALQSGVHSAEIYPILSSQLDGDPRWHAFLSTRGQNPEQLAAIEFNTYEPED